jgi:hypothetical protein
MARVTNRLVFNDAILPEGQTRWGFFSAGLGLECVAIGALVIIPLLMPQKWNWSTNIGPHRSRLP